MNLSVFRFLQLKVSTLMGTSLWCRWGIYQATLTPQTLRLSSVTCQVCSINSAVVILWSTCSTTASWHRELVISVVTTYFSFLWFYNYLNPSNKWFADIFCSEYTVIMSCSDLNLLYQLICCNISERQQWHFPEHTQFGALQCEWSL